MSAAKHTPTRFEPVPMSAPLILVDAASNFQKGKLFIKTSPDLRLVCTMGSEGTWMTRRATAKAIVSRYNSHDALVAALGRLVAMHRQDEEDPVFVSMCEDGTVRGMTSKEYHEELICDAEAALKAAKGEA